MNTLRLLDELMAADDFDADFLRPTQAASGVAMLNAYAELKGYGE